MSHYSIRRDALWRVPLMVIGASAAKSFVTVGERGVDLNFGVAQVELPLSNIREVHHRDWHWLYGIGIRIARDRTLGLVGSTKGVVQIVLHEPSESGVLLMRHPHNVAVSLEEPDAFIADVRARLS